jgi:hypothetical protein
MIEKILTQGFRFWRGETSLNVFNPVEILIGVAMISMAVSTADMVFWLKIPSITAWFGTCILWFFYILSLSLSTAFLLSRFISNGDFKQALTMAICVYWVVPLVPLFSLSPLEKAWGLGIFATIPAFRMIPTFSVENNYLPLGMLVAIPFILLMTSRFMAKTTGVTWSRVFVTTLAAFGLIYAYYYQWTWQVWTWQLNSVAVFQIGFTPWENMLATFIAYSFLSHIITFSLSPMIARSYQEHPLWIYLVWSGVPLVVFLLIPRVGVFSLFLNAGPP